MGTEYVAIVVTILFTIATSLLLGRYMFRVFTGGRTLLDPIFVPIERLVLHGVEATRYTQAIVRQIAAMERSARLYQLLGRAELLDVPI